jgi:hypothetical protein
MQEVDTFKLPSAKSYHSKAAILFTSPVGLNKECLVRKVIRDVNLSSGYYIASAYLHLYNPIWINITPEFSSMYINTSNDDMVSMIDSRELIFVVLLHKGNSTTWDDIHKNIWNKELLKMLEETGVILKGNVVNVDLDPYKIAEST